MRLRSRNKIVGPGAMALAAGLLWSSCLVAQEAGGAGGVAVSEVAGAEAAEAAVAEKVAGAPVSEGGAGTIQSAPNSSGLVAADEPAGSAGPGTAAPGGAAPGTAEPGTTNAGGPPTGSSGGGPGGTGTAAAGGAAQSGVVFGTSDATGGGSSGFIAVGEPGGVTGVWANSLQVAAGDNGGIAQLLANAMSRNPDITVAEAKVRAAQSELDRTRLDVSRQIVDTFQSVRFNRKSIEIAKAQVANCKEQQARIKDLIKQGVVSTTEVTTADVAAREAELALIKAEASLEATIATLDYLTGGQAMPGGMGMPGIPGMGSGMGGMSWGTVFGATGGGLSGAGVSGTSTGSDAGTGTSGESGATTAPPTGRGGPGPIPGGAPTGTAPSGGETGAGGVRGGGARRAVLWSADKGGSTFHERLRQKLDEPTSLDFTEATVSDVMRYIDDVHGITNIVIDRMTPDGREPGEETITLKLEKVPLSAALKAIEDLAQIQFVVTEYGLRLTVKQVQIEDSTPLRQFLRPVGPAGSLYLDLGRGGGGAIGPATGSLADPFGGAGDVGAGGTNPATGNPAPLGGDAAAVNPNGERERPKP